MTAKGATRVKNNPFLEELNAFIQPEKKIRQLYEDNLNEAKKVFLSKSHKISLYLNQTLNVLKAKTTHDLNDFEVLSMRDLDVYNNADQQEVNSFRWFSRDQRIEQIIVHLGPDGYGLTGFNFILENGEKSHILGKEGYKKPYQQTIRMKEFQTDKI